MSEGNFVNAASLPILIGLFGVTSIGLSTCYVESDIREKAWAEAAAENAWQELKSTSLNALYVERNNLGSLPCSGQFKITIVDNGFWRLPVRKCTFWLERSNSSGLLEFSVRHTSYKETLRWANGANLAPLNNFDRLEARLVHGDPVEIVFKYTKPEPQKSRTTQTRNLKDSRSAALNAEWMRSAAAVQSNSRCSGTVTFNIFDSRFREVPLKEGCVFHWRIPRNGGVVELRPIGVPQRVIRSDRSGNPSLGRTDNGIEVRLISGAPNTLTVVFSNP